MAISSFLVRQQLLRCRAFVNQPVFLVRNSAALGPAFSTRKTDVKFGDRKNGGPGAPLVPVRSMGGTSGDHVKMWTAERVLATAMVPGLILPFLHTTPLTDAIFCTLLVVHAHWGVEAIVVDYVRPCLFGGSTTIPKASQALVWVLSAFTLGSLYYFNYTDVGLVQAIKMLWKL